MCIVLDMETAEVTYSITRSHDRDVDTHHWTIVEAGEMIAELRVALDTGEILWVWVNEDHREEGHATRLYHLACEQMPVYHAPEWHRSDDGNRWAYQVGGPSIETCTCCDHLHDND